MSKFRKKRRNNNRKNGKSMNLRLKRLEKEATIERRSVELKKFDVNENGFSFNETRVTLTFLNVMAIGTNRKQRIGAQITMKHLKISIRMDNEASTTGKFIRVIIVWDKQNVLESLVDVLEETGIANVILSDYQLNFRNQYILLFDKVYNIDGIVREAQYKKIFIDLKSKITKFETSSDTLIDQGSLRIGFCTDAPVGSPVGVRFYSRITYTDS